MFIISLNFRHEINGEKVISAISQDFETSEILMVAYMNEEAFKKTLKTKKAHYWSTSRNQLWLKGESSGHIQYVKDILVDCDDSLCNIIQPIWFNNNQGVGTVLSSVKGELNLSFKCVNDGTLVLEFK